MKKLLIMACMIFLSCAKDELEVRPFNMGQLNFELRSEIPKGQTSLTAKTPLCSSLEPTTVAYNTTNKRGESYTYTSPITLVNGSYVSDMRENIPIGNYTINSIDLMNAQDTIYSVPNQDELQLSQYWDITTPMDVQIIGNTTVSGKVFCWNKSEAPDITGIIDGGFNPMRVQSMWFAVFNERCIQQVAVEVDGYRYPEIALFNEIMYEIVVPLDYTNMYVRAYGEDRGVPLQTFHFTNVDQYNPDGIMTSDDVIIFDYNCNL